MIPTEDNYVDWILFGIKNYFRSIDYKVLTFSIGQVKEKQCPIDRLLAVGNKIIGLQFKRPASNKRPFKFELTPHQHEKISKSRWIFYCLPDFTDFRFQEVALFHCKFVPGDEIRINPKSGTQEYLRWSAFSQGLIGCWEGLEINENLSIDKLISDLVENPKDTYLTLNKRFEELYIIRDISLDYQLESEPA